MADHPVFHAEPVRPRRQPSQRATGWSSNRSPTEPVPNVPSPSHHHYAQDQQQYHDGSYAGYDQHTPHQYRQEGGSSSDQQWGSATAHSNTYSSDAPHYQDASRGLRHRTGESISRSYNNANDAQSSYYGDASSLQAPRAPYAHDASSMHRPSFDSLNHYGKYESGWETPAAMSQTAHTPYSESPAGGNYFAEGTSQVHLVQSRDAPAYPPQTAQPGGPEWGVAPPPMSQHGPGGYGGGHEMIQMHNGADPYGGYGGSPQGYNSPGAGWQGLAAPGTVLRASPYNAGQGWQQDPGAYEQTRQRMMRKRTVKRIALQQGNLVLDVPIPRSITKSGQAEEFTKLRYTACTSDPDHFVDKKYSLRPWLLGRKTELAIVITLYNEDEVLLLKTLNAVMKNIAYLAGRTRSKTWGAESWKKVVIVIVADGRTKANPRMLKALSLMGLFQDGVLKDHVIDRDVTAHIFELTTQVMVQPSGRIEAAATPCQIIFCLKEKNAKKINSHRWFLNAFCKQLNPEICILLDAGTKPSGTAIYHLWKTFDKHPKVGGACGEMRVETGTMGVGLFNPLVAAQNFEYKISNILDKSMESVCGYISVLPGAFSAYRYKALLGRPLEAYWKGEALHSASGAVSSFAGNMYLAEDRILCFELVTKKNEAWLLRYNKSATAETDPPTQVPEFISQRRRWLNGSLFASIYALAHFGRIWTGGHNFGRKLVLQIQVIYNLVQMLFTWTSLGNFFLAFFFLVSSATSDPRKDAFGGQGEAVLQVVQKGFIALVVVCLILSLGNRPQGSVIAYHIVIVCFALIMALAVYCTGWSIYLTLDNAGLLSASGWTLQGIQALWNVKGLRDVVISLAATYVLWFLASIAHLDPWHMITSFIQYMLLTPFYVVVLSIYSLSNLHDLSWGTKGDSGTKTDGAAASKGKDGKEVVEVKINSSAEEAEELWSVAQRDLAVPAKEEKQHRSAEVKQSDRLNSFRSHLLLFWVGTNAALIIVFTSSWWTNFTRNELRLQVNPYLSFLFWATAGLSAARALGSFSYLLLRLFCH